MLFWLGKELEDNLEKEEEDEFNQKVQEEAGEFRTGVWGYVSQALYTLDHGSGWELAVIWSMDTNGQNKK